MWIELHDSARGHPKIIKLARDLGVCRAQALGHMCALWLWTLRMAKDGDLASFDEEDIEIGADWEGERGTFIAAAIGRNLIEQTEYGYAIHDWMVFAGSLKAAKRQRKFRERQRNGDEQSQEVTLLSRDNKSLSRDITLTDRPTDQTQQTRPDPPGGDDSAKNVKIVIEHFKQYAPLTRGGKTLAKPIRARLKEGYTTAELCTAIDNAQKDPWHKREGKCLDLKYLMREDTVVRFLNDDGKNRARPAGTTDDTALRAELVTTGDNNGQLD